MLRRLISKSSRFLLGVNAASCIRAIRFGPRQLFSSAKFSFDAAAPFGSLVTEFLNEIPEASLDLLLKNARVKINLHVAAYEDGMLPPNEALMLVALLCAERPRQVLEIGTYMGHTTRAMAENLETAVIHTVDLPPDFAFDKGDSALLLKDDLHLIAKRVIGREFRDSICATRIVQHYGDTAELDFSEFGQPTFF